MKFTITLDRDEDGMWVVECPSIPGCVSQGKTKDEALKNIEEAVAVCLEVRAEQGLPLTIETHPVELIPIHTIQKSRGMLKGINTDVMREIDRI